MFDTIIVKYLEIDDTGHKTYISTLGEAFVMSDLQELEAPFYAVISNKIQFNRYRSIEAAFEDKGDLVDWLTFPIRKELEKKFRINRNGA